MSQWTAPADQVRKNLKLPSTLLEEIGEQVILPMLASRFDRSGLKSRSGLMRAAVSQRGAPGNVFEVNGNRLTVGIDYGAVPHARYQLEGSLPHVIRPRKPGGRLVFFWKKLGRMVFLRKVNHPGTRARLVYQMDPEAYARANAMIAEELGSEITLTRVR